MSILIAQDLRRLLGPARDQGDRPTCLAFAASDAHAALRSPWKALSCEFVFYHSQRRAGISLTQGAYLRHMLDAVAVDGQPVESDWPYLTSIPENIDDYGPPAGLRVYRRDNKLVGIGVDQIVRGLDVGVPSLIVMMLSDSFYLPSADGVVTGAPDEEPDRLRLHAVVAIAHGSVGEERAVLIRNSWGEDWGISGYAWIPESFLAQRLQALALLTEDVDVSGADFAA